MALVFYFHYFWLNYWHSLISICFRIAAGTTYPFPKPHAEVPVNLAIFTTTALVKVLYWEQDEGIIRRLVGCFVELVYIVIDILLLLALSDYYISLLYRYKRIL